MSPASIPRALLSATDKTGLVAFAESLAGLGYELVSTGGTARALTDAGLTVVALSDYTGWPEMLDGRVKTLHPRVHAGILARRDLEVHRAQMQAHQLGYFDLVVVNLYDFEGALGRPNARFEDIVEQIDIGGPTLLRAAAKNHPHTLPVVDPDDYEPVLAALEGEGLEAALRRRMAAKVFQHTARYDSMIADFFERQVALDATEEDQQAPEPPPSFTRTYGQRQLLRYGENPHQKAAFYQPVGRPPELLAAAEQLQGKALSYNNLLDLDSAFALCVDLGSLGDSAVAVFVKHNNPCGVARAEALADAVRTARAVDPTSAFGAVVAVNRPVDAKTAEVLTEAFFEVLIAPAYEDGALEVLAAKKNLRAMVLRDESGWAMPARPRLEMRQIRGGLLVQSRDEGATLSEELAGAQVVTERAPNEAELAGLRLSWVVAKHVRSNAIVFGRADRVVAIGAGQMSRVDSVKLCGLKAPEALSGAQVASDAFFPFRDGVDVLAEAGATAIVQPGGSIRDEEVIKAANEHGVAMLFTGVRHFRH